MRLSFQWLDNARAGRPPARAGKLARFEGAEAVYREAGVVAVARVSDVREGEGEFGAVVTLQTVPGLSPGEVWGRAYSQLTGASVPAWASARLKDLERFQIRATWDVFRRRGDTWRAPLLGWAFYFDPQLVSRVKAEAVSLPADATPSECLRRLAGALNRPVPETPAIIRQPSSTVVDALCRPPGRY